MLFSVYRGATPRHGLLHRNGYATARVAPRRAKKTRNFIKEFARVAEARQPCAAPCETRTPARSPRRSVSVGAKNGEGTIGGTGGPADAATGEPDH